MTQFLRTEKTEQIRGGAPIKTSRAADHRFWKLDYFPAPAPGITSGTLQLMDHSTPLFGAPRVCAPGTAGSSAHQGFVTFPK